MSYPTDKVECIKERGRRSSMLVAPWYEIRKASMVGILGVGWRHGYSVEMRRRS